MFTPSKRNDFAQSSQRTADRDPVRLKMNSYNAVALGKELWKLNASQDRTVFIPPESAGLNSTTNRDAFTIPNRVESTMMSDGSMVCGDPVTFPFLKGMGSHHHPLQHTKAQFESPAKVFAKLKSKVHRGAMCADEGLQMERDMLFTFREKQGAEFRSPRKIKEDTWTVDKTEGNQMFNFADEAEALTLSPTPSPRKTLSCTMSGLSRKHPQGMSPMKDMGDSLKPRNGCIVGYTQPKRPVLEPTAGSHPLTKQIQRPSPLIGDLVGSQMTHRTPVKGQPTNLSTKDDGGRNVLGGVCVSLDKHPPMSPAKMFAHMKERAKKRKWEQQEFCRELSNGGRLCQPQERPASPAFDEDESRNNTSMLVFGSVQESSLPANQPEMNPGRLHATDSQSESDPSDSTSPPAVKRRPILVEDAPLHDTQWTSVSKKRCFVALATLPQMSPAKMFAHIKERERKRQQQEAYKVSSSTRELRSRGHTCQSEDSPTSTIFDKGEMEGNTCMDAIRNDEASASPANRSRLDAADSQSDLDPRDDILLPAAKSQPALVEDPLVIDSPRISIPKKREAVFKRNMWSAHTQFPNMTAIYLRKWTLRCTRNGLYVDGIHKEDSIPWHSNIIVERVSNSVLKTVSGGVYILEGKMNMEVKSELPKWLLKKFVYGFPSNWKMYFEKFQESRDLAVQRNSEGRSTRGWPVTPATNLSTKQHREKPIKTSASCPPESSSFLVGGVKISRSGRVIKPPLEYWKGGRVILDADMNVTVHECYDTTICNPQMDTPASTRMPQKPAMVFLPCSEGRGQGELTNSSNESSVPLRKVKTSQRKRNRAKASSGKNHTELPEETRTSHISSPEELSDRTTSQRAPPTEMLHADSIPQSQAQPNKRSTRRSKRQNRLHDISSARVVVRELTAPAPTEPPAVTDTASQSDDEFSGKRQKRGRPRKRPDKKPLDESESSHLSPPSPPSNSSEDSGRNLRKRTTVSTKSEARQKPKVHRQNKSSKTSQPEKPVQSSKKSSKGHKSESSTKVIPQEKDEEQWTEAELARLQQAVNSCPKHMGSYWVNVAMMVGTRSAEECQKQHTFQGTFQVPTKRARKSKKEETKKEPVVDPPTITARVGTLKRKQQVRQFLEAMPKDNLDDIFSTSSMQSQRFRIPSMTPNGKESGFGFMDLEPLTPMTAGFPAVKTPQCLHITPGMMGSPNRNNDDKYIYQLQKRMKKNQFHVYKQGPASNFTPTPSVKRAMRRCGNTGENDTFVVWEMFPDNDQALAESGEEEDFYFSDND